MTAMLASVAVASVPPPVVSTSQRLLIWTAGEARCDGTLVPVVARVSPRPAMSWQTVQPVSALDYHFRIDATGRPLSIGRADNAYRPGSEDIAPSLAAMRFAPDVARANCTIRYTAQATPLADSPRADLIAYSLDPQNGPLPAAVWQRIRVAGSNCRTAPRPAPLLRAFPDVDRIAATPGVHDWSMVDFDLDPRGRPLRAHVESGTGNAALDVAATKAVRASRFTHGARTGCQYPYWRQPGTVTAPPHPEVATLRPADSTCLSDDGWATNPPLIFPQPFRRRSIEGWAVVAFDIAPWGEAGNLRVLASEPAAAFGEQAVQMLRQARKPASPNGRSGCVQLVKFVIKDGGAADAARFVD